MTNPQSGHMRIFTKYHWLTFMLAAFSPKATINGHEVRLKWGENVLPAPLGVHQIEVHVPYLWKFGKASLVVDNTQGVPDIYYAAPVWTWARGAIGLQPQNPPGVTAAYIVYGVFFALILLCCCGSILLNGSGS